MKKASRLKREIHRVPNRIRKALVDNSLLDAYKERPPYQQNDYIGWITHAKLEATKQKRILEMLGELKNGDCYRKMVWKPR